MGGTEALKGQLEAQLGSHIKARAGTPLTNQLGTNNIDQLIDKDKEFLPVKGLLATVTISDNYSAEHQGRV
ncbi:UNVERIFIED_CONTAM: hypothetical protein K2H54_001683 [Gekko kuhli]